MAIDRVAFQRELWRRFQAAASEAVKPGLLGVAIGGERWLIPLEHAAEVLPLPKMQPVPRSATWFCGVTAVRGNVHGVVDLGLLLYGKRTPRDNDARVILLVNRADQPVGLLVNRALGLQGADSLQPAGPGDQRWAHRKVVDAAGNVWHELDTSKLLNDPEFNNIAA